MSGGMGGGSGGVSEELLTTKGDTHGFSTVNARVPIGIDTTVLTADSTQALGLAIRSHKFLIKESFFLELKREIPEIIVENPTSEIPKIASCILLPCVN